MTMVFTFTKQRKTRSTHTVLCLTVYTNMADQNSKWLRKASDIEAYFEMAHQKKLDIVLYTCTVSSSSLRLPDLLKEALTLLFRKVPMLRICFGRRGDELWLKEMNECNLDFEILEGVKPVEHRAKMIRKFDATQGPLWRFALLRGEDDVDAKGDLPRPFPHTFYFLLCYHHAVADGYTSVRICNLLRSIFDDLLLGRKVDPEVQLGDFVPYDEAMKLYAEEEKKLRGDPAALEQMLRQFCEENKTRALLVDVVPAPKREGVGAIPLLFDEIQTQKLIRKCKEARVTLHSFFTSAFNLAILDFLQENFPSEKQKTSDVSVVHDINIRRYYTGDTSLCLGVHLPTIGFFYIYKNSAELYDDFWGKTKELHQQFHSALANRDPLRSVVLNQMKPSTSESNQEPSIVSDPSFCYAISNMGDISDALSSEGDQVQITHLCRFVEIWSKTTFLCFNMHTFRRRLTIDCLYSTYYLPENHAARIIQLVHKNILSQIE